ncbi:MAG: tyrosine-type recombinase/integrase [Chthoniobacterales bacterium]
MHTSESGNTLTKSTLIDASSERMAEQDRSRLNENNGKRVANRTSRALGKNDSRYWRSRIFRPVNARGDTSPHYSMRLQIRGKRLAFSLGTGNAEAAARKAASVYADFLTLGVEGALAKYRPQKAAESITTVGEWIKKAHGVTAVNPATFSMYSRALRKIVGDIIQVKRDRKRYGRKGGGGRAYREAIDGTLLSILSPAAIQMWRLEYVKRAKTPAEERSRKTSCNSTLLQARSLFGKRITRFVPLPEPVPFEHVEFFPRQSAKYFSRIDAKALLTQARDELTGNDSPAFLVVLLALAGGLRKGEIDTLCWHQIDFERGVIRVENTDKASLKSADSRGEVPIDASVVELLRGFRARATGVFVIESSDNASGPRTWGRSYRAHRVFDRVTAWLRKQGVTARKPLHELRKELGALITAEHGIYAASRVLRHADLATTAAHYTDLKTRPTLPVGDWLTPENVVPIKAASRKGNATR